MAIDRVVDRISVPAEEAEIIWRLMANDVSRPISASFHQSRLAKNRKSTTVAQSEINIRYRLSENHMVTLNRYAKEYYPGFTNGETHDHAAAVAMRRIDHEIRSFRLPVNAAITDVNEDSLHHIRSANDHMHTCGSVYDKKELTRAKLRLLTAKQLTKAFDNKVVNLSFRFIPKDSGFMCNNKAQGCICHRSDSKAMNI